jgi:hypothetical protein
MNRSPFLTALFQPINLAMLALILAASLCSAWWLAPIGVMFWLVMVILVARDPGIQISFSRQNRSPLSPRFQEKFNRVDRARVSLYNQLNQTRTVNLHIYQPLSESLDDLVEITYQLCQRMSALDNSYAVQRLTNNADADIEKTKAKLLEEVTATERKEYEETLSILAARQKQLKQTADALDRFDAQLITINNAVDSVVLNTANLKNRNQAIIAERIPILIDLINKESADLAAFDQQTDSLIL